MTAGTATEAPDVAAPRTRLRSVLAYGEVTLDGRDNGLNLIRLVLAYAVLVAHGWYLAGVGIGPQLNGQNMGGWPSWGSSRSAATSSRAAG